MIAMKGRKQVGTLTSAERGTLCTAVICISAAGTYVPPMVIFPRVRVKEEFSIGLPPESIVACHSSGWMQLNLFEKWFDHFLKFTNASKENPSLLILDGHKTHTQNIIVIEKARDHGVTILCIPPHCSHRMQPLDVSFMAPLSTFYSQEVETFLRNNPGRVVTIYQIGKLFGKAYLRAATPNNAIHGFEKTGLFPVNRHVFTDDMFIAADPTDQTENELISTEDGSPDGEPPFPIRLQTPPPSNSYSTHTLLQSKSTSPIRHQTPPPSTSYSTHTLPQSE